MRARDNFKMALMSIAKFLADSIKAFVFCLVAYHILVSDRSCHHRLLQQAIKQHAARVGCAPVEAELELIEIGIQVLQLH